MKRKLILSLFGVLALFTIGAFFTIAYINNTTKSMNALLRLHHIDHLRQELVIRVQAVQSDLYTVHTPLGQQIDQIIEHVSHLDEAASKCTSCHHEQPVADRIREMQGLIKEYENDLSFYITASANARLVETFKHHAALIGNELLQSTQEMTMAAGIKLQDTTRVALTKIQNARIILTITLAVSFLVSLLISTVLTRTITRPVSELVRAVRNIASGDLGYQTTYRDQTEFGELAQSFNAMSSSLKTEHEKTEQYIERLTGLYNVTASFYRISEKEQDYREICRHIADLLKAQECILLLEDRKRKFFLPFASAHTLGEEAARSLRISRQRMDEFYTFSNGHPVIANEPAQFGRFDPLISDAFGEKSLILAWLYGKERVLGVLRISGREGGFTDEDGKILAILANHMAVAIENAELYRELHDHMVELRETQEQLIQSAKLAGIGELASNVAHEINNPLTSVIGFTELLKDETDIGLIRNRLDIIEKEALRARDIVRQLLDFARRRHLALENLNVNTLMKDVILLIEAEAKGRGIILVQEYAELPETVGDSNQIKQVFINIVNNAIAALHEGGTLFINTAQVGEYIEVRFRDTGPGIPQKNLHKVFEPFFTTKRDKGTGLGLSISYRIIQDHGGRIDVDSREGVGTIFTVRLPVKKMAAMPERA